MIQDGGAAWRPHRHSPRALGLVEHGLSAATVARHHGEYRSSAVPEVAIPRCGQVSCGLLSIESCMAGSLVAHVQRSLSGFGVRSLVAARYSSGHGIMVRGARWRPGQCDG
jgi:hypothetical protein